MKYTKKQISDDLFRLVVVIISNIILAFATVWFLEPAKLYSSGATGLAQLIVRIIEKCGGHFNLGLMIFIINTPIVIIGWRYVSHRFAIFSAVAIIVNSLFTGFLSSSPFEELSQDFVTSSGTVTNYGGILTLAMFGGLLSGVASGFALKFGTSTGGIDIIAQAFSLHKGISIGLFTFTYNIIIAFVGGTILQGSIIITLFTCVRLILNSFVLDKIHTAYAYTSLSIFTSYGDIISKAIVEELKRGCTIFEGTGAYSHQIHTELYCVLSSYEVDKAMSLIRKYDPHAFVVLSPIKKVAGNFKKKTIV